MRALTFAFTLAAISSSTPTGAWADPAPREFLPEVQLIYRVAACGGSTIPKELWAKDPTLEARYTKIIDAHCKALQPYLDKFKAEMFDKAHGWFVANLPKSLPAEVVYPFGGGDLISALVPFPDASMISTISLELAGDPRNFATRSPAELEKDLLAFRKVIGPAINIGLNSSINLSAGQRNSIPSQLASHLLGLAVGGFEVTGVRYFTLDDAGAIHYLSKEEIDVDARTGKSLSGNWKSPAFAQSFANVEVQFKKPGDPTVRVFRHIAWNLANDYLKAHPGLIKHLESKGKVTHVTKGGVYLLWLPDFSTIRKHLLEHLVFMVSDSTGIPPAYAGPAGMVQEPFGSFDGPMLSDMESNKATADMRTLWKGAKPVPFRFGYVDRTGHKHVLFTHPK
ncbi:MAG: hypothetical protein NT062_30305 [Proteobacteria bacterium]|nr:hypothetical protein [Pseudomonadota bacterium]